MFPTLAAAMRLKDTYQGYMGYKMLLVALNILRFLLLLLHNFNVLSRSLSHTPYMLVDRVCVSDCTGGRPVAMVDQFADHKVVVVFAESLLDRRTLS